VDIVVVATVNFLPNNGTSKNKPNTPINKAAERDTISSLKPNAGPTAETVRPSRTKLVLMPAAKAIGACLLAWRLVAMTIGKIGNTQGLIKVRRPARYPNKMSN
jgi:hypothetical protein